MTSKLLSGPSNPIKNASFIKAWLEKKGTQHNFFGNLTVERFLELLQNCRIVTIDANDILYRKGDPSDCFYFVLHGSIMLREGANFRKAVLNTYIGR